MIYTRPKRPEESPRFKLLSRYIDLTQVLLPSLGRTRGWPINEDHCFMRVVLDHLFQDCWYNHLDRTLRAYEQLTGTQLAQAIAIAESMQAGGIATVTQMNNQSLAWREQPPTLGPADRRMHGLVH